MKPQMMNIVVLAEAGISIRSVQDIPDLLGACFGAAGLLLSEEDLPPVFFELKSGFAGELLQKCVNYRLRTAIILPNPERYGQRFAELANEHRRHSLVRFVRSRAEANAWFES